MAVISPSLSYIHLPSYTHSYVRARGGCVCAHCSARRIPIQLLLKSKGYLTAIIDGFEGFLDAGTVSYNSMAQRWRLFLRATGCLSTVSNVTWWRSDKPENPEGLES